MPKKGGTDLFVTLDLLISKLIKLLQKLGHVVILDFVMATTLLMRVKQLSTAHRSMLFPIILAKHCSSLTQLKLMREWKVMVNALPVKDS